MKIVSFAASNSSQSINLQLLHYAVRFLKGCSIEFLDLNDYEMPIYSSDRELESGIPNKAKLFLQKIKDSDGLLISFAEHNGIYTAAFKNILDWCSRIDNKFYQNKPIVMLSASPGKGGANSVLTFARNAAPFFGGIVISSLSVPDFNTNFDFEKGILTNEVLSEQLADTVSQLTLHQNE